MRILPQVKFEKISSSQWHVCRLWKWGNDLTQLRPGLAQPIHSTQLITQRFLLKIDWEVYKQNKNRNHLQPCAFINRKVALPQKSSFASIAMLFQHVKGQVRACAGNIRWSLGTAATTAHMHQQRWRRKWCQAWERPFPLSSKLAMGYLCSDLCWELATCKNLGIIPRFPLQRMVGVTLSQWFLQMG